MLRKGAGHRKANNEWMEAAPVADGLNGEQGHFSHPLVQDSRDKTPGKHDDIVDGSLTDNNKHKSDGLMQTVCYVHVLSALFVVYGPLILPPFAFPSVFLL
jgi:hypothetical protein